MTLNGLIALTPILRYFTEFVVVKQL